MLKDNNNQTSHNKKSTKILVTAIVIGLLVCVAIPTAVYMHFSNTPDTTDTSASVKKSSTKLKEVNSSNQSDMSGSMMTDSTGDMGMTTDTAEEEMGLEEIDASSSADMSVDNTMMSQSSTLNDEQVTMSSANQEENAGEQTYTVQPQDNLYRIALNHGMTQQELMDLNGLTSSDVSVGQVLRVK